MVAETVPSQSPTFVGINFNLNWKTSDAATPATAAPPA
jgi:hypothetical protein